MPSFRISRRAVLRGAAGIGVGLPALEIMAPGRAWAAPDKRFVISYGGTSVGKNNDPNSNLTTPTKVGADYDVGRGLKPLADLGIRDEVTFVSGLLIPNVDPKGTEPVAPGGMSGGPHGNSLGPQVCGMRGGRMVGGTPRAQTADQIVANAIGGGTRQPTLAYRVQPVEYIGSSQNPGNAGQLSWRQDKNGLLPVDPTVNPRLAWESLTSGFVSTDGADVRRAKLLLDQRKSVLDLVGGDMQRLLARVGTADRVRLERHFEEVRGLERRLQTAGPVAGCTAPRDPGDPPAIGTGIPEAGANVGVGFDSTTVGYSGEDKRADALTDLIAYAFCCDQSRVASYMITTWKCWMNMYAPSGGMWKSDVHEMSHSFGPPEGLADGVAFIIKQFAKLVKKLKALPESDGTTVLDHTAMVMIFEGGHGFDVDTGDKISPHSTENMVALVAGGRACGLEPGQHVVAKNKHPAQVLISAMNAVGVTSDTLGEIKGNIPQLFSKA